MRLEPNMIVLYVDNIEVSRAFYQDLLDCQPEEGSATFYSFQLSSGMYLALKSKDSVIPPIETSGVSELAFTLESDQKLDELCRDWQAKNIKILLPPTRVPFGYTLVAEDPDGHRLRACSLKKAVSPAPKLKQITGLVVKGFQTRTQNSDEFSEKTAKIPALWQAFSSSQYANNADIYGIYSDYATDANGAYSVTVGIETDTAEIALGSTEIHSGNYLVFESQGTMPTTTIALWKYIWNYFETEHRYQRNFISDFEHYTAPDKVAIYIGVDEK